MDKKDKKKDTSDIDINNNKINHNHQQWCVDEKLRDDEMSPLEPQGNVRCDDDVSCQEDEWENDEHEQNAETPLDANNNNQKWTSDKEQKWQQEKSR